MFKKRKKEEDLFNLLGEEGYKRHMLEEDMKRCEEAFKDFSMTLLPAMRKIDAFKVDPDNNPHELSHDLQVEMELIHMKLTTALYRLRLGELQSKLKMKEIDLQEYDELTKELFEKNSPYIHI